MIKPASGPKSWQVEKHPRYAKDVTPGGKGALRGGGGGGDAAERRARRGDGAASACAEEAAAATTAARRSSCMATRVLRGGAARAQRGAGFWVSRRIQMCGSRRGDNSQTARLPEVVDVST